MQGSLVNLGYCKPTNHHYIVKNNYIGDKNMFYMILLNVIIFIMVRCFSNDNANEMLGIVIFIEYTYDISLV